LLGSAQLSRQPAPACLAAQAAQAAQAADLFENMPRDTRGGEIGMRDYTRDNLMLSFIVDGQEQMVLCAKLSSKTDELRANVRWMFAFKQFQNDQDLSTNGVYKSFRNTFAASWLNKKLAVKMIKYITNDGFQPAADLNTSLMRELAACVAFFVSDNGRKILPEEIFTKTALVDLDIEATGLELEDAEEALITAIDGRSWPLEEARALKTEMPDGDSVFYGPNPQAQATYCDLRFVLAAVPAA
jgi:hypothetical protein